MGMNGIRCIYESMQANRSGQVTMVDLTLCVDYRPNGLYVPQMY